MVQIDMLSKQLMLAR